LSVQRGGGKDEEGHTFILLGLVSSVSFVSFEKIEWAGLFGPELILRGESFSGDNDLLRSSSTRSTLQE